MTWLIEICLEGQLLIKYCLIKHLILLKKGKDDCYQGCHASVVYDFLDKNLAGSGVKNENILNEKLAKELHTPIMRKFNKSNVGLSLKDNL